MKSLQVLLLISLSFISTLSFSQSLRMSLDLANADSHNLQTLIERVQSEKPSQMIFEFTNSNDVSRILLNTANKSSSEIYNKNYPNGDFYYLIGDLDDEWTKKDYSRFYSVAKWLAIRGFRTIINVIAYTPDLQEALSNPKTSAILWNSHGSFSGQIIASDKEAIPDDLFKKHRTSRLKYVLFANCWGNISAERYGLSKMKGLLAEGWDRVVTSDDLFRYIFSTSFDESLSKAFGKEIVLKDTKSI